MQHNQLMQLGLITRLNASENCCVNHVTRKFKMQSGTQIVNFKTILNSFFQFN